MQALDWPVRQVMGDLLGALEVLKEERETICRLCATPCPEPPNPVCETVRPVMGRLARLHEAYRALAVGPYRALSL